MTHFARVSLWVRLEKTHSLALELARANEL